MNAKATNLTKLRHNANEIENEMRAFNETKNRQFT